MAEWLKLLLQPWHPIWMLIHILVAPLLIQLPANGLKISREQHKYLAPCTHVGEAVPAICCHLASEIMTVSLCFTLPVALPFK